MELTPHIERGANEFANYGAVGICALLFVVGAVFIVRWAFKKIDEAQTRQDALHAFYGDKVDLKEKSHAAEIQRMHEEYTSRMEATCEKFTESVDRIAKSVMDLQAEIRTIANQRGWDGTDRRHSQ